MEISALVEKFKSYAVSLKEIKHDSTKFTSRAFFHLDFEDLQSAIREGCKFPLMLVLTPEVGKDGSLDQVVENWEGSFMILDKLSNHANKTECINSCKHIADKVYNRMLFDSIDFFDGNLAQTNEGLVGPTADKLYGWAVPFTFTQAYDAEMNANDWEDIS